MCLLRHEEGIMVLVISDVSTLMRWKLSPAHVRRLRGPLIPGTLDDIHGLVVAYLSQLRNSTDANAAIPSFPQVTKSQNTWPPKF
ncbi:hypothetical protein NXS19_004287 [Fusarium pseudograminearum]|nr:hypothetical protein NXS19_004287 [Fusarium pseudograminearum]